MKNNTLNSLFVLVKKDMLVTIGGMIHKKSKSKQVKSILGGGLLAISALFIAAIVVFNSVMQTIAFSMSEDPTLGVMMIFMTAGILGLMFSLMRVSANQNTNDAELLLALPISRNIVVLSKTLSHYLYDLTPQFILVVPSVITYAIMQKSGLPVVLKGLVVTFMIPLLFVAISYLLNSILSSLTKKYKFTNKIVTVLTLVFLMAYMLIMMNMGSMSSGDMGTQQVSMQLFNYFPFISIKQFIFNSDFMSFIYLALICIVPFILSINIYSKGFGKTNAVYKEKNKSLTFEQKSVSQTLLAKELKRYFDCSVYVINTVVGPIMMILFAVIIIFKIGPFSSMFNMPELAPYKLIILISVVSLFMSMSPTTASAVSMEGKQLHILKALPINFNDVFLAKIKVNLIVTIPFVILGGIALAIPMGLNLIDTALIILVPSMVSVLTSFSGLMLNLIFPKLDWTSETLVVKQSIPVMYALLVGVAITGVPIVIYFLLASKIMGASLFYFIITILYTLITFVIWTLIKAKGEKMIMEM